MGKINIKLANNYIYNPQDAAQSYFSNNKTITIAVPNDIKSLEIPEISNLQQNFGCIGERESGGYWGLAVCYLKNQQAGFQGEWEKTQDLLRDEGKITNETRTIQKIATETSIISAEITNQLFVDGAKKVLASLNSLILNKQDDWEIDFNVQFDPSSVLGHDYKYTLGFSGVPGWPEGSTQPAGKHDDGDKTINDYFYPGAYGDVRAWMSGSNISFFGAEARVEVLRDDILKWQESVFANCQDEQNSLIDEQWALILEGPE
jgi:hypothetical protein